MANYNFVEKARISYLVFREGEYFGEVEQVRHDWFFYPRAGLDGERYAIGCCPVDALEQWAARNRKGELVHVECWPFGIIRTD